MTNVSGGVIKAASELSIFELDIETNPPKSSDFLVPNKYKRGKQVVRYYWKFDIEDLCVSQKGHSLSAMRRIRADEIARKELEEKPRPSWKRQCRDTVKSQLADGVWKMWSEDSKYAYARETFATDLTKESFQQWFGLTATNHDEPTHSPRFLKDAFTSATTKAAYARMDQAWIDDMAARLLTHMRNIEAYSVKCYSWHRQRITAKLERMHRLDAARLRDTCNICQAGFRPPGVVGFLYHMHASHEEYWENGSWTIL